ncbi:MAG: MFS transporter, partial [Gammaproteobacteria bacterium]|nr:MFS transporter [Gammaproteobacteria bacterium]
MINLSGIEIRAILSVCLLYMIRMLGLFMVIPVLPLMANDLRGATALLTGIALGIYGLSQAVLQIPLGILSDHIGRKPVIFAGLMVFVAGSFLAASTDSIYGVIAGRFLQGMGAIASTLMALVSDLTRLENRTPAMMMVGLSIGGTFFLSLVLGPWLGSLGGLAAIFLSCGFLGLIGMAVALFVIPSARMHISPETGLFADRL